MTTLITGASATTNEVVLNGSTSGTVTLEAPAVAGTTTLTLPSSTGTLATTADAYTDADALTLFNASGSAPVYACRAWVSFSGTGTVSINGSGNVTSITDNGTGVYTVNFTTAMPDANYSYSGISTDASTSGFGGAIGRYTGYTKTTSSAQFVVWGADLQTAFDAEEVCVVIHR